MILFGTQKIEIFFKNAVVDHCISEDRKSMIVRMAKSMYEIAAGDFANIQLNFICTHNATSSQFAQVWAYYAAHYFDLPISSYSGGTRVSSFHRSTVRALQEAGFQFNILHFDHQNPTYAINFNRTTRSLLGFSKRYDNPINKGAYFAITTCSDNETGELYIPKAIERFHLEFDDPTKHNLKESKKVAYLKTSKSIAAEVYLLFETLQALKERVPQKCIV
ncbi:hypothetical protein [Winogradskyella sp.]|uniref:hypothetical protein n=1 Tax=Winogradskyella sp. TaxID=1883156 RepID=UPI003AA8D0F8